MSYEVPHTIRQRVGKTVKDFRCFDLHALRNADGEIRCPFCQAVMSETNLIYDYVQYGLLGYHIVTAFLRCHDCNRAFATIGEVRDDTNATGTTLERRDAEPRQRPIRPARGAATSGKDGMRNTRTKKRGGTSSKVAGGKNKGRNPQTSDTGKPEG